MTNNVTTVTVKNKLGRKFKDRNVEVNTWVDGKLFKSFTISFGDEMMVYPFDQKDQPQLDSIDIEVLGGVTVIPIPISIDSADDLNLQFLNASGQNKWKVNFNSLKKPGVKLMGNGGDSNVNVTIGQDEPMELFAFLAVVTAIGLFAGPLLYGISPVLWGAAVGVTFVGAVAAWYKSAVKKQKKRKRTLENR